MKYFVLLKLPHNSEDAFIFAQISKTKRVLRTCTIIEVGATSIENADGFLKVQLASCSTTRRDFAGAVFWIPLRLVLMVGERRTIHRKKSRKIGFGAFLPESLAEPQSR